MLGQRYVFGPFVLDTEVGTLFREGEPMAVGYRALRLLTAFVDHPGEVLTKSDLIDGAWQGAAVAEANLTVQIASLRKLLGPSADGGDWIATIPRVGYRFIGSVDRDAERVRENSGATPANDSGNGPSIAVLPFACCRS
jgi:DNA-binding winged helix-turn-helix (wHTH) protein